MSNYCQSKGIYCEFTTDLGFCSVTACKKENRVSNISIVPTVFVTDTPMVEYAPVVRCKDCKWWKNAVGWGGVDLKKCELSESVRKPDWFCADGERREDAEANASGTDGNR